MFNKEFRMMKVNDLNEYDFLLLVRRRSICALQIGMRLFVRNFKVKISDFRFTINKLVALVENEIFSERYWLFNFPMKKENL